MMKRTYDFKPRTEPFPHQKEAIRFIINNKDVAIFDEQGLGKTKVVIDSLANEIKEKRIDSVLVICKKSLMHNWKEEIETHSHLSYVVIQESKVRRGNLFTVPVHFMIISYETAVNEVRTLRQLLKIKKIAIVLDESHKIKNVLAKTTQTIHNIAHLAKQRIILTGTPIANKPEDLWAQFYFLDLGSLLGDNFEEFRKKYGITDSRKLSSNQMLLLKQLKEAIDKKSIRRLKKNVLELSDKVYRNVIVPLNKEQRKIYDLLRDELLTEITDLNEEQVIDNADNILKRLLRLIQIASNPRLLNKKYEETPGKYIVLDKEVDEVIKRKEKAIIWTSFVDNIIFLKRWFKKYGAVTIYGRMTIDERNVAVKRFKEDPDCRIMIANPAAAREGLTLTAANNAIYLDRNFNLVDYIQSQDRIHRISQTKKCNIILLLGKDTVDQYIDKTLFNKHNIAGFIQGDFKKIRPYKLTKKEIVNLLEA